MSTKQIKLKFSSVPGKTPTVASLPIREIGINTYDGKLFIKKNDGTESIVEIGGGLVSDPTGITGATEVTNIVQIGQADYANLTPDAGTVYIINGA